jgi:hypothetical protein
VAVVVDKMFLPHKAKVAPAVLVMVRRVLHLLL